jgi:hypothetical protein
MTRNKVVYGICSAMAVLLLALLCASPLPWAHRLILIGIWSLGLMYGGVSLETAAGSSPRPNPIPEEEALHESPVQAESRGRVPVEVGSIRSTGHGEDSPPVDQVGDVLVVALRMVHHALSLLRGSSRADSSSQEKMPLLLPRYKHPEVAQVRKQPESEDTQREQP